MQRDKIVKFCEKYLNVKDFQDYCHNGLQIEGSRGVNKIIVGVSLSMKLIDIAIKKKAQMMIVHHGIFINMIAQPPVIKGVMRKRLGSLMGHDINLCGYHLPLDAHPIIGNNISLCKLLGIKKTKPFEVGYIGILEKEMNFSDFAELVDKKLNVNSYIIPAGPKKIRNIAVCSGAASSRIRSVAEYGVDVFLTGDVREETVREVEEMGINFINAGHYNTERSGIRNLGELLKNKFKIEVEFVDIPCDI